MRFSTRKGVRIRWQIHFQEGRTKILHYWLYILYRTLDCRKLTSVMRMIQ